MVAINRKRAAWVIAVHLLAITIGVSTALGGATPREDVAFASHNCTRYGPFSYPVNTNCLTRSWMDTCCTEGWITNSYAQRDSNVISIDANRNWYLRYDATPWFGGYGVFGSSGGHPGQNRSYCSINGSSVNGRCTTYWD